MTRKEIKAWADALVAKIMHGITTDVGDRQPEFIHQEHYWIWGKSVYYVADDGRCLVTIYFGLEDDFARIADLIVHPRAQRRGRGDRMLDIAEREVTANGLHRVCVQLTKKDWVYDWFLRRGYSQDTNRNDIILLEKTL